MALSSYATMVTDTGGEKPGKPYTDRLTPPTQVTIDPDRNTYYAPGTDNLPLLSLAPGQTGGTGGPSRGNGGGGGRGGGGYGSYSAPAYEAPILPSATAQNDYINSLYAANLAAQKAALESEYNANASTLNQKAANIPATYDAAANQAAAQAAINRQSFNESAAASGMNTGAGSQARLSQNNALQGNISAIRQAQAQALADVDAKRAQLSMQYQSAIADAVAQNEVQKAQALYDEAKRVDESIVSTAANQAQLNFSAWRANY